MKSMFKGAFSALVVVLALSGLMAASALAAGAPIVETKPANSLTETTAYLNGVVNPNGVETKDYFEYGPTVSYGSRSREQTTTGEKKPEILVEGLTRGTTYHFRMVATNSYGTSYGADETFTTAALLPEAVVSSGKTTELAFEAVGKGGGVEWGGDKSVSCNKSSFTGHFLNSKELEGTVKIYHCSQESSGCFNESSGGEFWIQSELLRGILGYTNKAKKEVGLRLSGKSLETWAKSMSCIGIKSSLTGQLGGTLNLPVNTKLAAGRGFSLEFKEEKTKQLTGELGGQLLWEGSEDFAVESTLAATANKEFEIKA
jgi:hypothetical protein